MSCEKFKTFKFKAETLDIIDTANEIIYDYQAQGFDLTLRQLYYQFVARDLIPNSQKSYSRLGDIINNGRLAGLIDWTSIEDRTRRLAHNQHWDSLQERLNSAAHWYDIDTRATQEYYIEVWVEKEALVGIVETACTKLDIPYFACRGYVSQTSMYEASKRIIRQNKPSIIIHLGDHDPSGIDMTRDISERLNQTFNSRVFIERIALNMDQVERYNPPENPAKLTDSRCKEYMKNYGCSSWELDALDPKTIIRLIDRTASEYTDEEAREELIQYKNEQKELLTKCANNWDKVEKMLLKI